MKDPTTKSRIFMVVCERCAPDFAVDEAAHA